MKLAPIELSWNAAQSGAGIPIASAKQFNELLILELSEAELDGLNWASQA